ncbi:hypothetical protein [Chryseobacterium formosense]|uniref:hypothetical protein n=1 Tax=Chryseobacterium formosense TaxID=236814 RepID=UPI000A69F1F6|nr:hypothetical protein [Chryseobacterium formosense]
MKNILLFAVTSFLFNSCLVYKKGEDGKPGTPGKNGNSSDQKNAYNQKLADSLGADQYGMKGYTIVMLTTGTAKIDDKKKQN